MSWVISQWDITIMWYLSWGKHCDITCEITGNKETHHVWYHVHFSYHMRYHIWHHSHVPVISHCDVTCDNPSLSLAQAPGQPVPVAAGTTTSSLLEACSTNLWSTPDPSPPPPQVWAALVASGGTAAALPSTNGPRAVTTAALLQSHLNCCAAGNGQRCQSGSAAHGMVQKNRPCAKQKWPR